MNYSQDKGQKLRKILYMDYIVAVVATRRLIGSRPFGFTRKIARRSGVWGAVEKSRFENYAATGWHSCGALFKMETSLPNHEEIQKARNDGCRSWGSAKGSK